MRAKSIYLAPTFIAIICVTLLAACGKVAIWNGIPNADSVAKVIGVSTSSSGWPGLCQLVQLQFYNNSSVAAPLSSNTTIGLSSSAGTFYSDSSCSTSISNTTGSLGAYSANVYFKQSSAASVSLAITASTLSTGTASITVARPSANLVLGQVDFVTAARPGVASSQSFNTVYQSFSLSGKLFVADYNFHRALIWNSIPTTNDQAADIVLGQPNMTSNTADNGGVSAASLNRPSYVSTNGTQLFLTEENSHRVLIWNTIPTANQQAANIVLGQPNMTSNTDNNGGTSASSLSYPQSVDIYGTKLIVADYANIRVLIWNTIPTANQQPADVVVCQANMTSNLSATTSSGCGGVYFAAAHDGKLIVSDSDQNRVLIWNTIPTSNGQAANVVIGQPNMTSSTANNGGISGATLSTPGGFTFDSQGRFYLADYSNNRVLVWNSLPTTNGQSADAVIGQANMTSNTSNSPAIGASSISTPWGINVHDSKLWVTDNGNNRIIKYDLP